MHTHASRFAPAAAAVAAAIGSAIFAQVAAAQDDALPTGEVIIKQFIEAVGGAEAIDALETAQFKATIETPDGEASVSGWWGSDDRFLIDLTAAGAEKTTFGHDGETVWMHNAAGYALPESLRPGLADTVKAQMGMFFAPFDVVRSMREDWKGVETLEVTTFNDQECFKVKVRNEDGDESTAYFNRETHLLAGVESVSTDPLGMAMTLKVTMGEWKDVDAIKVFTRLSIIQQGQTLTVRYEDFELNAVEETKFDLPEEVKELVRKAKEEAGKDEDDTGDGGDGGEGDGGGEGGRGSEARE